MIDYRLKSINKIVKAAQYGGPEPLGPAVQKGCGGWLLRNRNGILRLNPNDWVIEVDGYTFVLPSPVFLQLFEKV